MKNIYIEEIELGDSGKIAKDKINSNLQGLKDSVDSLNSEVVKTQNLAQTQGTEANRATSQKMVTDALNTKANKTDLNALSVGLVFKEPVATKAQLATVHHSAQKGWACIVKDEGIIYQNGGGGDANWVNTGLKSFPEDVLVVSNVKHIIDGNSVSPVSEKAVQLRIANVEKLISDLPFKNLEENGFAIMDAQGNASLMIDDSGKVSMNLEAKSIERLKDQLEGGGEWLESFLSADVNHIISYGQSLGEGYASTPVLTSKSFSDYAKMFNHGVQTRYAPAPKYQSFVPHVEKAASSSGETPCAGITESLIRQVGTKILTDKIILSSCCAVAGTSITDLSKGSAWYNNIIADVTNGNRLAKEQGRSYRLIAVTWTQGEYDYGTPVATYKQKLTQLRADLIADIGAITGDDYSKLPFVMYQVSSGGQANQAHNNFPAIAQLELGMENAANGFYLATPIYHLNYVDMWHLDNYSSKFLGGYYGYVLSKVAKGEDWQPLCPVTHTISGNTVLMKFNKKGLTFERPPYLRGQIANRGFSIQNAAKAEIITGVEIVGSDIVKLTCSESPSGLKVRYGFNNTSLRNAGELRDDNPDTYVQEGFARRLYNWCTIFNYQL